MDGILQGLYGPISLIHVGSVIGMDSIINSSNMGSTILIGMFVALMLFMAWGCLVIVYGVFCNIFYVVRFFVRIASKKRRNNR